MFKPVNGLGIEQRYPPNFQRKNIRISFIANSCYQYMDSSQICEYATSNYNITFLGSKIIVQREENTIGNEVKNYLQMKAGDVYILGENIDILEKINYASYDMFYSQMTSPFPDNAIPQLSLDQRSKKRGINFINIIHSAEIINDTVKIKRHEETIRNDKNLGMISATRNEEFSIRIYGEKCLYTPIVLTTLVFPLNNIDQQSWQETKFTGSTCEVTQKNHKLKTP